MELVADAAGRRFDNCWALRDVSFAIQNTAVVALLGANGSGKTTLLRLLAGTLPLSAGSLRLDDHGIRPTATAVRRQILFLDDHSATPRVRSHQQAASRLAQLVADHRADRAGIEDEVSRWVDALSLVGALGRPADKWSRGQRYKLSMIGMFVVNAPIWLLDEPFSAGLDAGGLEILEQQCQLHALQGGIVVFSSQWPEHARRLADRVLVLHEGSLVWDAEPSVTPSQAKDAVGHADDADGDALVDNWVSPELQAVLRGLGE